MTETICALATGPLPSAIAVVRISGPAVRAIGDLLLRGGLPEPRVAGLRRVNTPGGALIDEGLALFMPGPESYTGEDTLELSLHGGRAIVEQMLSVLTVMDGVRLAEPGEFTRRAFQAGKLDLLEAEGVADVIEAETVAQKDQALRQLGGSLSETYGRWRAALLKALALLDVSIDFPDEDDAPQQTRGPVAETIQALSAEINAALADDHVGERIRDGFRVAIVGPPNAGKSSLLNRLAKRDAAIVTNIAGTTRDVVEVRLVIGGAVIWLADTAGLRDTDDPVEREGVRRAEDMARRADLRFHVVDAEDPSLVAGPVGPQDIVLFNKCDLRPAALVPDGMMPVSTETGEGLDRLTAALESWVRQKVSTAEPPVITRARHRAGLRAGLEHLEAAQRALDSGAGAELVAEDVRLATRTLGALVGDVAVEDVLGAVFSEFCIGK